MKTCFLFGHRNSPYDLQEDIIRAVNFQHTEFGVEHFVVGSYGNFDRMAARAVILVRKEYPQITLSLLLPYHPAERPIETPLGFDNTYYPLGGEKVPRRFAIVYANQHMIKHADSVICYAKYIGNARLLYELAHKRKERDGIYVQNLAETN